MSEARYNVVVSGSVLDGFELEQVKAEFSRLFSLAENKTEEIFAKGNVVIKKNVAEPTAQKFVHALERIGAAAHVLESDAESSAPTRVEGGAEASRSAAAIVATTTPTASAEVEATVPAEEAAAAAPPRQASEGSEADAGAAAVLPFQFHGNGTEYFRIWIVNILLTIITLGIYSAWAKVRNAQYFYGNTEVAGSRFAYHAKPLTILKGRLIAVALFVLYSLLSSLYPLVGVVLALLLVVVMPWIVVRSLRFNLRMTAWRNLRFGFDGQIWPAATAFILWPLAGVVTVGILMPLALYKQQQFIINNCRYGTASFSLNPCGKAFYLIFAKAFGMLILAGFASSALSMLFPPASMLVMLVAYLYLFAFVSVRMANLIYGESQLRGGDFDFSSDWSDGSYLKLMLVNTLCTVLTLGLFYPWAKVRVAQYKAEHLALNAHADLDSFVAGEAEQVSALGEEMGDVFDMEVAI